MDGTQTTPTPERPIEKPVESASAEQLAAEKVETKSAPAAEMQPGQVKRDDGSAQAAAQVATVTAGDQGATTAAQPAPATLPVTAADVDVIEPAWVQKAEDAVTKYRDDPRAEEDAVEDLQRKYLKARYDLDIKSGEEKP